MLQVLEDEGWITVTGDKVMSDLDPANLLLIQGIFWVLSSACQLIAVQTKLVGLDICLLKVKGAVFSAWTFSLEASILLNVFLAFKLLVYLQFCFVNPWLDVLKEDRLTSLASLVCYTAEQGQLQSLLCLLIQCSCYHSNTPHVSIMKARREAVWYLFLFAMVAVTPLGMSYPFLRHFLRVL